MILGQSYVTRLTALGSPRYAQYCAHHTSLVLSLHQTTKYTKATHSLRPSLRRQILLDLHLAV